MDFDKDYYQNWRAKCTNNRRLFLEDPEISKIETDKIFSSTALEEPVESQFSLRLSESYVDETQESSQPRPEPVPKEVVVISDSSSDESILPPSESARRPNHVQRRRAARVLESSEDESARTPVPQALVEPRGVVRVSDSGSEPSAMQRILKETVAESATLSERKKKEILNWLASNFDNTKCTGSSYSTDSIVSDSRKSTTCSSGNSSLERLEMNFETPNNRGKIKKSEVDERSSKQVEEDNERQSRLGKCSKKLGVGQLNIIRDRTPGSKTSEKTPTNISKPNPRRLIRNVTPVSAGSDRTPTNRINKDKTPASKNSDKTPINSTKSHARKIIKDYKTPDDKKSTLKNQVIPETQSSELVEDSEDMPVSKAKNNIIIPDSESFESKESSNIFEKLNSEKSKESLDMFEMLQYNNNNNNNKNCGKQSSILQNFNDLNIKNKTPDVKGLKKQSKVVHEEFEMTDDIDTSNSSIKSKENQINQFPKTYVSVNNKKTNCADTFEKSNNSNRKNKCINNKEIQKIPEIIPDELEITDDIDNDKSPKKNLTDQRDQQQKQPINQTPLDNTTINSTINDCADILENLYGESWRNQAKTLISATEPRKHTKKLFRDFQTEKKTTFRQPQFDLRCNDKLLDKENSSNIKSKGSEAKSKQFINRKKPKDSFINDGSTTESSPDCSYYTALSNPRPSQNNLPTNKTASTVKVNDKNNRNIVIAICDSESDDTDEANENWKMRGPSQRKLNFDSSSSSITSEFDPDDIVPPKTKVKTIKIKKLVNHEAVKSQACEKQFVKKSFLASLSKEVPPHQADFNALTYRNKYSSLKEELSKVLFKLFNEKVFDNKLPQDMPMEWSIRLRGTAGQCYNKQSIKALGKTVRSCKIALATKVLDSPERLRDTLIHEMCHAATWLINNISDGHGRFWKAWAYKAMKMFPELPPISRCHNYEIQTKYTYKCISCGYSIGRHSKSLNLDVKRCGYCHGKFELLINKVTKDGKVQKKSSVQTKEPTGFALYVKENYQLVKKNKAITKHGDVMKILGQQFSAIKLMPKPKDRCQNNDDQSL